MARILHADAPCSITNITIEVMHKKSGRVLVGEEDGESEIRERREERRR